MGRVWGAVTESIHLILRPFEDVVWEAEIDFVYEEGLPFGLLGYEGFLNRWSVTINGYFGYFIIEQADHAHAREDPEIFAELRDLWPGL